MNVLQTAPLPASAEPHHKHFFFLCFKNAAQQEMSDTNTASAHVQCLCLQ